MYLQLIKEDPNKLKHIIKLQKLFRKQKFKKCVYALITKKRMQDPKYVRATALIKRMVRKWKFRRVVRLLVWSKRMA